MRMSQNARGVESEVNESVVVTWEKGNWILTAQDLHPPVRTIAADEAHPSIYCSEFGFKVYIRFSSFCFLLISSRHNESEPACEKHIAHQIR